LFKKFHAAKAKLRAPCIFFIGAFFSNITVQGQKLVNTTGNTIGDNNLTIEYSIGEISITTLFTVNSTNYVTQGLLQPSVKVINPDCAIINDTLNYFPNPAVNILSVIGKTDWITGYRIYASDGKLVRIAPFISNQINMYHLPGGVYFIKLYPGCDNKNRILKVIKQ
jgi:hypothetical protein